MLHEGAHAEPEAVEQSEVVLHHLRAWIAGVSIIPLIRTESAAKVGSREVLYMKAFP